MYSYLFHLLSDQSHVVGVNRDDDLRLMILNQGQCVCQFYLFISFLPERILIIKMHNITVQTPSLHLNHKSALLFLL